MIVSISAFANSLAWYRRWLNSLFSNLHGEIALSDLYDNQEINSHFNDKWEVDDVILKLIRANVLC